MAAHNFIVRILLTTIIFLVFMFGYMFNEFCFQVLQVKKCNASEELQHICELPFVLLQVKKCIYWKWLSGL
jgi:hypothetical protein